MGFNHIWDRHLTTALGFSLARLTQFNVDGAPGEEFNEEPRTVLVTTPSITYDTRNSFVRPTKGLFSS